MTRGALLAQSTDQQTLIIIPRNLTTFGQRSPGPKTGITDLREDCDERATSDKASNDQADLQIANCHQA